MYIVVKKVMNRNKGRSTLKHLITIIKMSALLLIGIIFLHGIFSKPLKDMQFVFETRKIYFEFSCEFFEEDGLKISK